MHIAGCGSHPLVRKCESNNLLVTPCLPSIGLFLLISLLRMAWMLDSIDGKFSHSNNP